MYQTGIFDTPSRYVKAQSALQISPYLDSVSQLCTQS
jgi:hypothetical protein